MPVDGSGGEDGNTLSFVCPHCHRYPFAWEEALQLVVKSLWRQIRMESAQQDTVVQLGVNANEAKVFKANAASRVSVTS